MTAHTQGPWEALAKWDERTNGALIYAQNTGNAVASALYLGGTSEARANARLIATAPDLLEALLIAMPHLDNSSSPGGCDGKQKDCSHCRSIRMARAAIAKATGEKS